MDSTKACLTFIFHHPKKLVQLPFTQTGQSAAFLDLDKSALSFEQYLDKYFAPICESLSEIKVPVQICMTSSFLAELSKYNNLFTNFQKLTQEGYVEIALQGQSLTFLYSMDLWEKEIKHDLAIFKKLDISKPKGFNAPDSLYFNEMASSLSKTGFKYCFAGAIDWYLGHNYNERVFKSKNENLKLCLIDTEQHQSNFNISDQKNLFMIFDDQMVDQHENSETLINWISSSFDLNSITATVKNSKNVVYDVKQPISGSVHGKQLSSYKGNSLQNSAIHKYYDLGQKVAKSKKEGLFEQWISLGDAFFFLQMNDQPGASSFANNYMLLLADLELRLS